MVMKSFLSSFSVFILITVLIFSCKPEAPKKESYEPSFSTYQSDSTGKSVPIVKNEIFYGLLTPVEISSIFQRLNVHYDKAIVNPASNRNLYLSSSKVSINLGIYGVDFGYIKMFNIGQQMIDYLLTIRDLNNKLGIPDKYLLDPIKSIESNLSDSDTIMAIMNNAYSNIENHLRKDHRESVAGLMLMGGWVEAMYIATQLIYNPIKPDPQVVQRIAEQKYTLTSLLSFMKNYYDDPVVVFYTKKLIFLKRYFDTFDIYFKKGDLEIDNNRQILKSSGSEMTITVETLNKIRDYVSKLRTEMTQP
jgi:hypothetical protein